MEPALGRLNLLFCVLFSGRNKDFMGGGGPWAVKAVFFSMFHYSHILGIENDTDNFVNGAVYVV